MATSTPSTASATATASASAAVDAPAFASVTALRGFLALVQQASSTAAASLATRALGVDGASTPLSTLAWLPLALSTTGHAAAANYVLDELVAHHQRAPGQFFDASAAGSDGGGGGGALTFDTSRGVAQSSLVLLGAVHMSRWDVASPAATATLLRYQSKAHGGFGVAAHGDAAVLDATSTALAGLYLVNRGYLDQARRAGDFLVKLLSLQPDVEAFFYPRFTAADGGNVLTSTSARVAYVDSAALLRVDVRRRRQHAAAPSIVAAFLVDLHAAGGGKGYLAGSGNGYLDAAAAYVEFDTRAPRANDEQPTRAAAAWAAAALFRATREQRYAAHAARVAEAALLRLQSVDGTWPEYTLPTRDDATGGTRVTETERMAEAAYVLQQVARGLSACKTAEQ